MSGPPDGLTELQNRLVAGEAQALAEFFDLHRERLWRMANFRLSSRLRGRISPDDVIQQAYLEAAKRIKHCRQTSSPFVWIRMIVRQTLTDMHRRHLGAQKRDAGREVAINQPNYAHTTAASLAMQLVGDWTSPSQAAVRGEKLNIVQAAIENMDPIDREVLALRHFEELTNAEVAEELDIQPKAASIRYIRALQRLRGILSEAPGLVDGNTNA